MPAFVPACHLVEQAFGEKELPEAFICLFLKGEAKCTKRSVVVLLKGRVFEVGLLLRECFRNLSFHPGQSSAV